MAKHSSLNIPTSIVISGVESDTYFDIVVRKSGVRFVLMSYHYLQKKEKDFLKKRIEEFPDLKIFIDSGAHTFLSNRDDYVDKPMSFWETYIKGYQDFLTANKDYIFACANLDIEAIVGIDKVDEWNDKYFKPVEESGIEVCYIWHSERGQDGWREMCSKHSYVGLSYENDAQMTVQRLMSMINVAKKTNTRVHGMALTKSEILARVPLFSADSSVDGNSKVLVRYKTKNPTVPYKMEQLSIKELYDKNIDWEFRTSDFETRVPYKDVEVLTVDNNNNIIWGSLYGVVKHIVKKPTIKLKVQGGKEVICTTDHSIITMDSEGNLIETKADTLKVGDYVLSYKVENTLREEKPNYINADVKGITFLKIKDIEQITDGTEEVEVYDLSVEKYERFFANGILVHNTTWLVGQQYGELNWFDGRKMKRLSKDQWRRQYKTQLLKEPFNADWELLTTGMGGKGDTYELLRLNVIAYKLAEEHIRKRLKNKMYWLPKGDEAVEVVEVDSLETPPYEWFDGECDDWQQYLMKLRIMPSGYSKDEAVDLLYLFYIFLNEDYRALKEDFEEQEIIDYAKAVISESIEDYESAVEALRDYFVKNATGERNDLRGEDDMDEELGIARPKEREVYIEEDVFDIIDLSEEQIEKELHLPAPKDTSMPEVEAYDEELARNNIVAVRDEKGRFLKGQRAVRKPKNIYSKKYPKLNCDTCYKSGDCPEYKPGYVCAFDKMFKRFDTRNAEDVIDAMSSMINHNLERLQRAMMFEIMDGGMATPEVTGLIDQNAKLLEKLQQLQQMSAQTILQQRRTIMADGTETIENSMSVNPSSGGILSQIFGGLNKSTKDGDKDSPKNKEDFEDVIEVEYGDGE